MPANIRNTSSAYYSLSVPVTYSTSVRKNYVINSKHKVYSPEMVDAVVESKRMWIYRNLAEWKDLNASVVAREWVNGETFLYLGRSYRLALVRNQGAALLLKKGRFCLDRTLIEKDGIEAAEHAFEAYLQIKVRNDLKTE